MISFNNFINEGKVKQFEMDLNDMIKDIKSGYGWIDPEYVADTWENTSDTIEFELVKGEIYKRLIDAKLLAYADDEDEESAGKYIKSLKELGLNESVVTEAKALTLDKLTKMIGDNPSSYDLADFIYTNYDKVTGLKKSMRDEEMNFPKEIEDLVDHYGFDLDDFTEDYGMAAESFVSESKITLKRRYTENHPAVTVGKNAAVRNKMLEAIKDGKITREEFNNILKEFSKDSSKWLRRNSKFFNVSEDGIALSKIGSKTLKAITINEVSVEEGNAFIYAAAKAKRDGKKEFEFNGKTYKVTLKTDVNLKENKNMKTTFIYESFSEFVNTINESNESLNEAFASAKLASILTGANKMDKDLPKAFYNMAKIALDKIQDVDIIEMDPATAKKEKRANAIYMYFTTNAKENPYAGNSAWREEKEIPGNTLLAITDGSNEWMATEWQRSYSRDKNATRILKTTKRDDSAGFAKSGSRDQYGSGISSMKQVAELADRAYCLDLDILRARYSTDAQRDERAAAKKGAIAFKNDKEFKAENMNRYNTIIANRAVEMPIDKMVADAIDTISNQIKDGLAKGEKGRYGDIIVGRNSKGVECKLSDAARHMQSILDDFQRYVNYTNEAEKEKEAGYGGSYYEREVKNYAKRVTDKLKQVDNFSYVW